MEENLVVKDNQNFDFDTRDQKYWLLDIELTNFHMENMIYRVKIFF